MGTWELLSSLLNSHDENLSDCGRWYFQVVVKLIFVSLADSLPRPLKTGSHWLFKMRILLRYVSQSVWKSQRWNPTYRATTEVRRRLCDGLMAFTVWQQILHSSNKRGMSHRATLQDQTTLMWLQVGSSASYVSYTYAEFTIFILSVIMSVQPTLHHTWKTASVLGSESQTVVCLGLRQLEQKEHNPVSPPSRLTESYIYWFFTFQDAWCVRISVTTVYNGIHMIKNSLLRRFLDYNMMML